eukprot:gb/GFBE01057624.1/.p1 GENE.gb/GFBE01057624.1/~~gb/GFBE01057624.1/.p1  ORF type:complete len:750 (+),score=131.05 gb/GFBE01057624.1/:1-2250(+)
MPMSSFSLTARSLCSPDVQQLNDVPQAREDLSRASLRNSRAVEFGEPQLVSEGLRHICSSVLDSHEALIASLRKELKKAKDFEAKLDELREEYGCQEQGSPCHDMSQGHQSLAGAVELEDVVDGDMKPADLIKDAPLHMPFAENCTNAQDAGPGAATRKASSVGELALSSVVPGSVHESSQPLVNGFRVANRPHTVGVNSPAKALYNEVAREVVSDALRLKNGVKLPNKANPAAPPRQDQAAARLSVEPPARELSQLSQSSRLTPVADELEDALQADCMKKARIAGKQVANERVLAEDRMVFGAVNAEVAKERVRKAITRQASQKYEAIKEEGCCQWIAKHPRFDMLTMLVIGCNTLWQSVDTELNTADVLNDASWTFIFMENLFCTFFVFEIAIRFAAHKIKWHAFRDVWFVFDFVLVLLMVFEVWIVFIVVEATGGSGSLLTDNFSILRVGRFLRVLRTARMARLVRMMPELMILVKGMLIAGRSVFFTLLLLAIVMYMFAIAFIQLAQGTGLEDGMFQSMGSAMTVLLLEGILPDQGPWVKSVSQHGVVFTIMALFFILVGSLTVMNMLLGVLVEVVKTVSVAEREQLDVNFAQKVLHKLIKETGADEDGDNKISADEFVRLLATPEAARALASLGIDVVGAIDFLDVIFEDSSPLEFQQFMDNLLMLRGNNVATVKDVVEMRKFVAQEFSYIVALLSEEATASARSTSRRPSVIGRNAAQALSRVSGMSARSLSKGSSSIIGSSR